MIHVIEEALKQQICLECQYDGKRRLIEPHAYGESTAGNDVVRVWQSDGESNSGKVPAWKMMEVSKMKNLHLTSVKFLSPRPGYKRGDRGMKKIYNEL